MKQCRIRDQAMNAAERRRKLGSRINIEILKALTFEVEVPILITGRPAVSERAKRAS